MSVSSVTHDTQQLQLRVIWSAILGTVAVYALVCFLALGAVQAADDGEIEWMRQAFSAVAVGLGGLSLWWRRHFLTAEERAVSFAQAKAHGVVTWALSEAVGLCGLVLALVVRSAREFLPFGAAAAALLLLHRPSRLLTAPQGEAGS